MKIAVRGGHNPEATGSNGIINELTEDRKVKDAVIKYLSKAGHEVLDVTPGNSSVMDDLVYGVSHATNWGAELFISCHFDNCYDHYDGALGHACWVYSRDGESANIAARIVNKVTSGTGLISRGVRTNPELYELRKTTCPSIIVETCFVESVKDVEAYRAAGPDKIGELIAEAISNKEIASDNSQHQEDNHSGNSYSENGTCTVHTTLNIRTAPNTSSDVVGQYHNGESVVYDTVVLTEQYVWISWIGGSGKRRYMAIKDRINNKRWGTCV